MTMLFTLVQRLPLAPCCALVFVALLEFSSPPAAAQSYTVKELGALPNSSSTVPLGVNNLDQVVGRSGGPSGAGTSAFLWSSSTGIEDLGTLAGGDYSVANDVNDSGQVVGFSNTATGVRAFLWTRGGGVKQFALLTGDSSSQAFAINASGQAVGASGGPNGNRAVIWASCNSVKDLGTLPGDSGSVAIDVNGSGQVVGYSTGPGGERAFIYTGSLAEIGTLAGANISHASAINNSGLVVGTSGGSTGGRAFIWTQSGGIQSLETLPGDEFSEASDINDLGYVVGSSRDQYRSRAFIWSINTGLQDLNTLIPADSGIYLSEASSINASGQIVAFDSSHEGAIRAFLLTPTVLPASADLSLTATLSPEYGIAIDVPVTYNYLVSNGASTQAGLPGGVASHVTFTASIPPGMDANFSTEYAPPSQGFCNVTPDSRTIHCDLGDLSVGATAAVQVNLLPHTLGTFVHAASVSASEPDPNTLNNTISPKFRVAGIEGYGSIDAVKAYSFNFLVNANGQGRFEYSDQGARISLNHQVEDGPMSLSIYWGRPGNGCAKFSGTGTLQDGRPASYFVRACDRETSGLSDYIYIRVEDGAGKQIVARSGFLAVGDINLR